MTGKSELDLIVAAAQVWVTSPIGAALLGAAGWIVLDAMLTAALELKLGRFAPEAFSYFLEKLGGEFLGLAALAVAATVSPLMVPFYVLSVGAFVVTESNGVYQKIQAFIASNKSAS